MSLPVAPTGSDSDVGATVIDGVTVTRRLMFGVLVSRTLTVVLPGPTPYTFSVAPFFVVPVSVTRATAVFFDSA
ncbi:MAG: hypothetical protein IPM02_21160 [Betaproteobacteria bacterium]|nr:hypothetical protein [Betaproteobacteria bacterium]